MATKSRSHRRKTDLENLIGRINEEISELRGEGDKDEYVDLLVSARRVLRAQIEGRPTPRGIDVDGLIEDLDYLRGDKMDAMGLFLTEVIESFEIGGKPSLGASKETKNRNLPKDIEKASLEAIDEISCQPSYGAYGGIHCGWSAEVLKQKLVDLGHDPNDIWIAPEAAIHQWLAIDDLVIDIWEVEGEFKLKYWHYTDPKVRRGRMYHWPGMLSGIRPADVDKLFSKEEISWYYHHYWEPKKLPKGLS